MKIIDEGEDDMIALLAHGVGLVDIYMVYGTFYEEQDSN
jgi:hypothetical protein